MSVPARNAKRIENHSKRDKIKSLNCRAEVVLLRPHLYSGFGGTRNVFLSILAPRSSDVIRAKWGRSGETGKHDGLKIHCPQGLEGSTPSFGTKDININWVLLSNAYFLKTAQMLFFCLGFGALA